MTLSIVTVVGLPVSQYLSLRLFRRGWFDERRNHNPLLSHLGTNSTSGFRSLLSVLWGRGFNSESDYRL